MNYAPSADWVDTMKAALALKIAYTQVGRVIARYGGSVMQIGGRPLYYLPDLERIRVALEAHREYAELRERTIEAIQAAKVNGAST